MCHGDHNQEPQENEKCDVSMDTIFQIADEVMETPPNNCLVRVVPLEKPGHVIVSTSSTNTISSVSTMQDNPLCDGPIIMSTSGNAYVDKVQEELVLSVPEQMPEDAIFEVSLSTLKTFIFSKGKETQKRVEEVCREKRSVYQ